MITQLQYKILKILQDNNCSNRIRAITVSEIRELLTEEVKLTTLNYNITQLLEDKHINYGLPDGKSRTFYISFLGEDVLKNIEN